MALLTAPRMIERVERMWLLPNFLRVQQRRSNEVRLNEQLSECVRSIWADPRSRGLNLEQLKTESALPLYSARINQQFRLIFVLLSATELALLHFDNHDEAYAWVRRHEAQLPSMLERMREVPRGCGLSDGPLLPVVREDADDPVAIYAASEFEAILNEGVDKYLAYLDPQQKRLADLPANGLLLIKGGAGTGKSAVAAHRLAHLQSDAQPGDRPVLFLCYNKVMVGMMKLIVQSILDGRSVDNIEFSTLHAWCYEYHKRQRKFFNVDEKACRKLFDNEVLPAVREGFPDLAEKMPADELWNEIDSIIVGCGLETEQEYLSFNRKGCLQSLRREERIPIWQAYEQLSQLKRQNRVGTWNDFPNATLAQLHDDASFRPYRAVVVDEGQDFNPVMLRLARFLAGGEKGQLTVMVDPAQDIYDNGFVWAQRELKVKRGNVHSLKSNFRNTRTVATLARSLVEPCNELQADLEEARLPDRPGEEVEIVIAADERDELDTICRLIAADQQEYQLRQIAVCADKDRTLNRMFHALKEHGIRAKQVDKNRVNLDLHDQSVKLITTKSIKGLDFPAVYVVSVQRPSHCRSEDGCDDLERRALYTAFSRASQKLVISAVYEEHHPLLEEMDHSVCIFSGSKGREFANLYGSTGAAGLGGEAFL